jgi:hypothetical protein
MPLRMTHHEKLLRDLREGKITEQEYREEFARMKGYPSHRAMLEALAKKHGFPTPEAYEEHLKRQQGVRERTKDLLAKRKEMQKTSGFFKRAKGAI